MITTNISYILNIIIVLFLIGSLGLVLNRKNILITIMSVELMLLAVNLNFIIFFYLLGRHYRIRVCVVHPYDCCHRIRNRLSNFVDLL